MAQQGEFNQDTLVSFGVQIDTALDQNNHQELRELSDSLRAIIDTGEINDSKKYIAYYYLGNAMQGLHQDIEDYWKAEFSGATIICFRQALYWYQREHVKDLPVLGQITTNLGNHYSAVGRYISAFSQWRTAIDIPPPAEGLYSFFPIAKLAFGRKTWELTASLYDPKHAAIYADYAYSLLSPVWENRTIFLDKDNLENLENDASVGYLLKNFDRPLGPLDDSDILLGHSPEEKSFRRWGLNSGLFINPLNDVSTAACVCHDVMCFPPYRKGEENQPILAASFAAMKSEYAYARFSLYEALHVDKEHHFSDEGLYLIETSESSVQGFRVEKIKSVLRIAFSLFDKIAMLINEYYGMGHSWISFSKVWYQKGQRRYGLLSDEAISNNSFLCALYWLSKDVAPHNEDEERVAFWTDEPTRIIYSLRNHIEHGYVRASGGNNCAGFAFDDTKGAKDYAYIIPYTQLVESALSTLKLAREALIYTGLAIAYSENEKNKERGDLVVPLEMPIVKRTKKFQDS